MQSFFLKIMILIFSIAAHAFAFGGTQPAKEFLQMEVQSLSGSNTNLYGFSVEKLVGLYQESGKVTWEKDKLSWIMKVDRTDKTSNEKVKIAILLSPTKDKKANITRMTIDKDTLSDISIMKMMSQTSIALNSAAPSTANSKTVNSNIPSTLIEDPNSQSMAPLKFGVKQVADYFVSLGGVAHWTSETGEFGETVPVLKVDKIKGISSVEFVEAGCFNPGNVECFRIKSVKGGKPNELIKAVSAWLKK